MHGAKVLLSLKVIEKCQNCPISAVAGDILISESLHEHLTVDDNSAAGH